MILSLITKERYSSIYLPERREGVFALEGPDGGELFTVEGNGEWVVRETSRGHLPKGGPVTIRPGELIAVRIGNEMRAAYLYAENADRRYAKYARCQMPDNGEYTVGSARDNFFSLVNPNVSLRHCKLTCRDRVWSVTDLGSRLGTFVNGKRTDEGTRKLAPGDVVSVLNQKFIVLPGLLAFNAQNVDTSQLKGTVRPLKVPPLPLDDPCAQQLPLRYFRRHARFTSGVEGKDFSVTPPPAPMKAAAEAPAYLSFGPAMVSGAAMLLAGMNPITGVAMIASPVIFQNLGRQFGEKTRREQEARRQKMYDEYLGRLESELNALQNKQTAALRKQSPDPKVEAEHLLRDRGELWSRRPEHSDFMTLRLGLGNIPVMANIAFPQQTLDEADDPMREKLRELQNTPRILPSVPILLELERYFSVGISGDRAVRASFAAQLIGQLVMHIGYDDMKLCLLGPLSGALSALRWLPHTWDNERLLHLTAKDKEELDQLLPSLDSVLERHRKDPLGGRKYAVHEELVILITDADLAQSGALTRLLFDDSYERVHVITLASHLPSRTDVAIGIRDGHGQMVWQDGNQRPKIDFTPDQPITGLLPPLVRLMANTLLDVQVNSSVVMPEVVPFLDLFGVHDVRQLNMLERWERADPARTLRTPIGVGEDGKLCTLDISERADGPHGLIAGTTGSGKSELIMSYILSMAVSYSPEDISFLLIDYKGGGMAQAFSDLPHTVGVITNLDGSEINRSLMSIRSELERRQRVFSDEMKRLKRTTLSIEEYQRLYRLKKIREPMPRLIIITDEFAELKAQEPDFMQQLISAARVGRSLGVHLILATQRPSGIVDDQISSNTNFRLCLRVQDPRDSQDVLKCPDAASLTRAGQFYKQVGYAMVKAQSAWTGANYTPNQATLPSCGVEVLDNTGAVLCEQTLSRRGGDASGTQAGAVAAYITELARRENICIRSLWQPVLEERIPLSDLRKRYAVDTDPWILEPILGELDDPANQRRALVRMDLSAGKNTIVYGGTGSGKVMLLSAMLEDLLLTHTPEQLHLYILDYFDDGLYTYTAAPHVGDVLSSDDDEKLARLLGMLEREISLRRKTLGGVLSSAPLSERLRAAGKCHILVVLHNLGNLKERLGDSVNRLISLLKDGPRWGVSFLATQESASGLSLSLTDRFAQKYVLQMDHDDDYSALLGRVGKMRPPPIRGRGLLRADDGLFEFQSAAADQEPAALCLRLRDSWAGQAAPPIRVMPEHVTVDELAPCLDPAHPLHLPVGLGTEAVEPVYFDFAGRRVHMVLGRNIAVTRFLRGLLPLAVKNGVQITALDPNGALEELDGVETVRADALPDTLDRMIDECIRLKRACEQGQPPPEDRRLIVLPAARGLMNALQDADRRRLQPLRQLQDSKLPLTAEQERELQEEDKIQYQLRRMLETARPYWGWVFLVCDTPQDFRALRDSAQDSAWVAASISPEDGLFLGTDIRTQTMLQIDANASLKLSGPFPKGYVVRETEPEPVRFVEQA